MSRAQDETRFEPSNPTGAPGPVVTAGGLPPRYQDLGPIASGGGGEVRRVHDTQLDRVVAMKLLHRGLVSNRMAYARFLAETHTLAELQHPGIVAIHDSGVLADGRPWYTMKEIRGRTLREVIADLHMPMRRGSRWPFRRVLGAFLAVCETMAYAHANRFVHRDLKPDNLMVGEFGEVLVMDWGLARRLDDDDETLAFEGEDPAITADRAEDLQTQAGAVLGTPVYMPPEQASGDLADIGRWSDVYALGAILYTLLSGRRPYSGDPLDVIAQVLAGPPKDRRGTGIGGPEVDPLWDLVERAMTRDPYARPGTAATVADAVRDWLDGARRTEQAKAMVARADALAPGIRDLRARAARVRDEARMLAADVPPTASEDAKMPVWRLEDRALALDREATLAETRWLQTLRAALNVAPRLPEAHERLADHYRDRLVAAEAARDPQDTARFEALLRDHDQGRHAAFLAGTGALTLHTDPPGARATLLRWRTHGRRLVTEAVGELGVTPLIDVPIDHGSVVVLLERPGHAPVRLPVYIARGCAWQAVRPGDDGPRPVWLPPDGQLGPDEVYVPGGWFVAGGDPEAAEGLTRRRVWVDPFVIDRFPITNRRWLAFLNDLVDQGRHDEALAAAPHVSDTGGDDGPAPLAYARDDTGRFHLRPSDDGSPPGPALDAPVVRIDWHAARAFARWRATPGRPWRLPNELEWEKAARGVDGRCFPWGDHPDATWGCMLGAHRGDPHLAAVHTYPLDEGPYGVRGLAGNVRDFCDNLWTVDGPPLTDGLLVHAPAPDDGSAYRAVRGGSWAGAVHYARSAVRFATRPDRRFGVVGVRCVRAIPVTATG